MYSSHTQWMQAPRAAPSGQMLFAVGDIHGLADELSAMSTILRSEIDDQPGLAHSIIHLGDYIDRGPASKRTLEILAAGIGREVDQVYLVGNHDQFLIELLNLDPSLDRAFIDNWYDNGGIATMRSLAVTGYGRLLDSNDLAELRSRTMRALRPELVTFLKNLKPMHVIGNYVFVHAGINPSVGLDEQEFADLLLMREPFLSNRTARRHPFCVIHGHSIAAPSIHDHRVGVDAGCFVNGVLCAVQIKEDLLRFIGVTGDSNYPWDEKLGGKANGLDWSCPELVAEASAGPQS